MCVCVHACMTISLKHQHGVRNIHHHSQSCVVVCRWCCYHRAMAEMLPSPLKSPPIARDGLPLRGGGVTVAK